jgi:hypothetical protein
VFKRKIIRETLFDFLDICIMSHFEKDFLNFFTATRMEDMENIENMDDLTPIYSIS